MLESCNGEIDNLGRGSSDFIEGLNCRDMRSFDEKRYAEKTDDEAQTEEDADEGWDNQKQSPLAGRMSGTMEELERIQSSELEASDEVRECLKDSLDCYQTCSETTIKCSKHGRQTCKIQSPKPSLRLRKNMQHKRRFYALAPTQILC